MCGESVESGFCSAASVCEPQTGTVSHFANRLTRLFFPAPVNSCELKILTPEQWHLLHFFQIVDKFLSASATFFFSPKITTQSPNRHSANGGKLSKRCLSDSAPCCILKMDRRRTARTRGVKSLYLFVEGSQISVLPHAAEDLRGCFHHLCRVSAKRQRHEFFFSPQKKKKKCKNNPFLPLSL